MNLIDKTELSKTATYQELERKGEVIRLSFINSLSIRKQITNGYLVAKHTGTIPANVQGLNYKIVQELLDIEKTKKSNNSNQ